MSTLLSLSRRCLRRVLRPVVSLHLRLGSPLPDTVGSRQRGLQSLPSEEAALPRRTAAPEATAHAVNFGNYHAASRRLVENADRLIDTSRYFLGDAVTYALIERTFFKQFCAGKNAEAALSVMHGLRDHGVGAMFDGVPAETPSPHTSDASFKSAVDRNVQAIVRGIECAAMDTGMRLATVKVASITSFQTLEKFTSLIDHATSGEHFVETVDAWLRGEGAALLREEDLAELTQLKQRLHSLAMTASSKGVRLLVDAEESEIQPAIDYVVLSVMEGVNRREPWILQTYQCYLKNAQSRLRRDMEDFLSKGLAFGVKLVRGAYLQHETALAAKRGRGCKVLPDQAATDASYDACMKLLIDGIRDGENLAVCLATHNQASIEKALQQMSELGVDKRTSPIYFAQLHGMRDYLTYALGQHHYQVAKLLVFGEVQRVMPYLVRRSQENSNVLSGSQTDIEAMQSVLKQRTLQWLRPKTEA